MQRIIFYSWQSDLPNKSNRGFIQKALESAATAIQADESVAVEPVIDRDTQGVPGSPDIAATIFAKITAADAFVADVSIINRPKKGRPNPNPNVLIELGYALKALGQERVILVFNTTSGSIQDLPFDLRTRRLVIYKMSPAAESRADERKRLTRQLSAEILAALDHAPTPVSTLQSSVMSVIENQQPNRVLLLRRSLEELLKHLDDLEPVKHRDGGTADDLLRGIEQTQELVAEFSKTAETISMMRDLDSALEVYRWFGKIMERYSLPPGYSGRYSEADHDYFKFIGHELFVTLIAYLVREGRWEIVSHILSEPIPVRHMPHQSGPGTIKWQYISAHLELLLIESKKRGRASLHADVLKNRHTSGGLSAVLPFDDFIAADFFLFLMNELPPSTPPQGFMEWRAWSALYLNYLPLFIKNAEHTGNAEQLIKVIGVPSIHEFKERLRERVPRLGKLFHDAFWRMYIEEEEYERIGTR